MRAKVKRTTGRVENWIAAIENDDVIKQRRVDSAVVAVEIVQQEGAFYLFRLDERDRCVADTWHATEAEAKAQAEFEFGITSEEWDASAKEET